MWVGNKVLFSNLAQFNNLVLLDQVRPSPSILEDLVELRNRARNQLSRSIQAAKVLHQVVEPKLPRTIASAIAHVQQVASHKLLVRLHLNSRNPVNNPSLCQ